MGTWSYHRRNFRVYLRHPQIKDSQEFIQSAKESLGHLRPWIYPPITKSKFEAFVRRANSATHQCFLICHKDNDEILGTVNFNEIVRGCLFGCFSGFYLFVHAARKGYMREGLGLALKHGFEELKLHRVEANIQPGNQRSIALVKNLGFRLEGFSPRYLKIGGRWRDHERWAIVKEEFFFGKVLRKS